MWAKNFYLLVCILSCIFSVLCAPNGKNTNDINPSANKEEKLASIEEFFDDTTTMESETIKIQENEIDSEILRDEIAATTIATEMEKSTASPLVPQQNQTTNSFDTTLMRKRLIEHFRKQLTSNAVRAIFLVLNELKRRQNMKYSEQQDAEESRIVESRVQHEACDCKCDKHDIDNVDEDEAEIIIIDKTSRNRERFLPKENNRPQKIGNKIKQFKQHEDKVATKSTVCETCSIKGIEEMLYKY